MALVGQRYMKTTFLAKIQSIQQHANIIAAGIIISEQNRVTYIEWRKGKARVNFIVLVRQFKLLRLTIFWRLPIFDHFW